MRQIILLAILLLGGTVGYSQNRVSGTITDSAGRPLPAISVRARDTRTGVSTGPDGTFILTVPASSAVIDVTGVGFLPQTLTVQAGQPISITLDRVAQNLSEVVVT